MWPVRPFPTLPTRRIERIVKARNGSQRIRVRIALTTMKVAPVKAAIDPTTRSAPSRRMRMGATSRKTPTATPDVLLRPEGLCPEERRLSLRLETARRDPNHRRARAAGSRSASPRRSDRGARAARDDPSNPIE
jgi:hypothetical protein